MSAAGEESAKNAHVAVQLAVLVARSALQQELHQLQVLIPDVIMPLSPVHCLAGELFMKYHVFHMLTGTLLSAQEGSLLCFLC